jgi:hypothetical protein
MRIGETFHEIAASKINPPIMTQAMKHENTIPNGG